MRNDELLIRITNLHRSFTVGEVDVHVLRGINLEIQSGEFLIIKGESGSGKSTLMNMIGGIDKPSKGSIVFDDFDISQLNDKKITKFRRNHVGFIFQFYNLVPTLTAVENVATATEIAINPMNPKDALQLVGLGDRLTHFPSQLSGGQQQRVSVARAIAKRPSLLLCDEPTGALDQENTVVILELLQKINRETGTTVVMITHSPAMSQIANKTAIIKDGIISEIIETVTPVKASEIVW